MPLIRHGRSNDFNYFLNAAWPCLKRSISLYKSTVAHKVADLSTYVRQTIIEATRQSDRQTGRQPGRGGTLPTFKLLSFSAPTPSHSHIYFFTFFPRIIFRNIFQKFLPIFASAGYRGNRVVLLFRALYAPALEVPITQEDINSGISSVSRGPR